MVFCRDLALFDREWLNIQVGQNWAKDNLTLNSQHIVRGRAVSTSCAL